jgi:phage shock protein A
MSLLDRALQAARSSVRALLAPAEDPRRGADPRRQHELLGAVRLATSELRAARERIQDRRDEIEAGLHALEALARAALAAGDRVAARAALRRQVLATAQAAALAAQAREIEGEEQGLALVEHRLLTRIESVRARERVVAARRDAAEAQVRVNEALTGLSAELGELGAAVAEAERSAGALRARSDALEELVQDGTLELVGGEPISMTDVERAVDVRLAVLAAEADEARG